MAQPKWGILGAGNIASQFAEALNSMGAEIPAVYARKSQRAQGFAQKFGIPKAYSSLEDFLADENVDIVYIASTHNAHFEHGLKAIEAGKHVLCEKPFTVNYAQAKVLAERAQAQGVFLMEAMSTPFLPAVNAAMQWIAQGEIGTVRELYSSFHIGCDGDVEGRLLNPKLAGGALLDVGIYPISLACKLFGGVPAEIKTTAKLNATGVDSNSVTLLEYAHGRAIITSGIDYNYSNNALIVGDKGVISIPDYSMASSAYLFKNGAVERTFNQIYTHRLSFIAQAVMDSVAAGELQNTVHSIEDTLAQMQLMDELRRFWGLTYPQETEAVSSADSAPLELPQAVLEADPDWHKSAVFYHVYPLGFCGSEAQNNFTSEPTHAIRSLIPYAKHIAELGCNALYLGPLFEASAHGYDTADFLTCDRRLGDNLDIQNVVNAMHNTGIRVILDGVFNHVGREFWAFKDVREKGRQSPYTGWFKLNFEGNSNYNDGFWYEGWEGHFELVKLNLENLELRSYLLDCVEQWLRQFDIDGLRLDVAYSLNRDFMRELRQRCKAIKPDFFLLGECIHGDYASYCKGDLLDSVTNYQCYKGMHSAVNSGNMFEIAHSLNNMFGPENWTSCKGLNLYSFLENHDVSRIATLLEDKSKLSNLYTLLYTMPGIPSVYYGGEWEAEGSKQSGDSALRPSVDVASIPQSALSEHLKSLSKIRRGSKALCVGGYVNLYIQANQLVFLRSVDDESVLVALNFAKEEHSARFNTELKAGINLLTGQRISLQEGALTLPPSSAMIIKY
ncbi:MAG: Gfo/Idh/MocA family oxidoreductase [Oscillospiraceae bacterium]|nr:Gfo/Idh/MocA family oxidoreductase [Oscillospiraceae bacterium]